MKRKIDAPDKSITSLSAHTTAFYQNTDNSQESIQGLIESDSLHYIVLNPVQVFDKQIKNAACEGALQTDAFQDTGLDDTSNAEQEDDARTAFQNADPDDDTRTTFQNADPEDDTGAAFRNADLEDGTRIAFQNADPDDTVVEDPFTTLSNLLVLGSSYSYESPPSVLKDSGDVYNGFNL
ncbi:6896_t:CDS:1 [Cetraspora pellucida]|uniref:6896_t:CDS:1 n=1 Tax=Cetraspora pellucida TaxID=1433469 RepID=A0ACA9P490_9GLOM|nr:6896_t:CDS:1 [Cetraspora pellucida]